MLFFVRQVYAGGKTSGAHYNPAVTIAVSLRRFFAWWDTQLIVRPAVALFYILFQLAGAVVGGRLAAVVTGSINSPSSSKGDMTALTGEIIATFFLCYVVLQTATVAKTATKEYFGIAIGFTVAAMAVTVGGISGGALNPAVGFLSSVTTDGLIPIAIPLATPWYYAAGPAAGGVLAALIFRMTTTDEFVAPARKGMV